MKTRIKIITIVMGVLMAACGSTQPTVIPLTDILEPDDAYTIIWNGISEAWRYENGQWVKDPGYDYHFNVVQKRYNTIWKSIKTLHRLHPDYDGRAGNRDQTMYFEVEYVDMINDVVSAKVHSSIGNGKGNTDNEFRQSVLEMYVENPSRFLPYNKFRITQQYNYEGGMLTETVELIKEKNGVETPFMKNEEKAWFFMKGSLPQTPTTFKSDAL